MRQTLLVAFLLLAVACGTAPETSDQEAPARKPAAPEPAAAVEVYEETVTSPDGVPIAYDVRGAGETAVIFVHCWSCDREFWREQADLFARDFRVVTLDLPGHGASGANREEWSLAGLAADVEAVANALGLERIVLVGHSMGGPVSLLAAQRMPGRVIGVACVDTLHNAEDEMPPGLTEMIAGRYEKEPEAFIREFVPVMFMEDADPALVEWVAAKALRTDTKAAAALMRDFDNLDMPALFSEAGVPIRCVNAAPKSEQQPATEIEINRKYADYDAYIIENVGHYIQLERPRQFNKRLSNWVKSFEK